MKRPGKASSRRRVGAATQYTLRGIPAALDESLRAIARAQRRSLNQVAIDAMARGAGVNGVPVLHHDLDFCFGTWQEDPEFDAIIAEQDMVDPELWR
jgi:hypothetical protein